jgi:hypothetical protein
MKHPVFFGILVPYLFCSTAGAWGLLPCCSFQKLLLPTLNSVACMTFSSVASLSEGTVLVGQPPVGRRGRRGGPYGDSFGARHCSTGLVRRVV